MWKGFITKINSNNSLEEKISCGRVQYAFTCVHTHKYRDVRAGLQTHAPTQAKERGTPDSKGVADQHFKMRSFFDVCRSLCIMKSRKSGDRGGGEGGEGGGRVKDKERGWHRESEREQQDEEKGGNGGRWQKEG